MLEVVMLDPGIQWRKRTPNEMEIWVDVPTGITIGFTGGRYYTQDPVNGAFCVVEFHPSELALPAGA